MCLYERKNLTKIIGNVEAQEKHIDHSEVKICQEDAKRAMTMAVCSVSRNIIVIE